MCNNDGLFFKELFQLISLTWRNLKAAQSHNADDPYSGIKSAPWLVSFREVIRCDIGVSATGCLLQLYVQKNMTVFVSLCTFSELCNYPCHLYRAATATAPTQMYNSGLVLGKKRKEISCEEEFHSAFFFSKCMLQKKTKLWIALRV